MVTAVVPSTLDEVICATPGICANCRSSGWATEDAMVSGLAPGSWAVTWMVGKSTCGSGATGRQRVGGEADKQDAGHEQRGGDRVLDEGG